MLVIVLLGWCALATASHAIYYTPESADEHFQVFIRQYDKQYGSDDEMQMRFEIFKDNLLATNEMNNRSSTARFGINQFTDLTRDEFLSMYTGFNVPKNGKDSCQKRTDGDIPEVTVPDSRDWRNHSAVTRVKNQVDCGSCWAFSAIGNLEGQYAIKHGKLQEFSEQQLFDCDTQSDECNGGDMSSAFESVIKTGGLDGEQDYPYTARNGTCKFDVSHVKAKVTGCYSYTLKSEDVLKRLVYQTGPISIALQAEGLGHGYTGGIIDAKACSNNGDINHAVLIVGYGVEDNKPYWIVKNSWGAYWGLEGYFRLERGNNACKLLDAGMTSSVVA